MKLEYTHEEYRPNNMERVPYIQIKISNDFKPFCYVVIKIYKSKTHVYYFDGHYHLLQKARHQDFNVIKAMRAVMVLYDLCYSEMQLQQIELNYLNILRNL